MPKLPYEKGSLFLRMLEARVGRERFDAFLRDYFDRHAFGSMDTPTFLAHLEAELLAPAGLGPEDVGVEEWVHGPGVPADARINRPGGGSLPEVQRRDAASR